MESLPRVLVYGPPPERAWHPRGDVEIRYVTETAPLRRLVSSKDPTVVVCLHAPPSYRGGVAARVTRNVDDSQPLVVTGWETSRSPALETVDSDLVKTVGLPDDEPLPEALFDIVDKVGAGLDAHA